MKVYDVDSQCAITSGWGCWFYGTALTVFISGRMTRHAENARMEVDLCPCSGRSKRLSIQWFNTSFCRMTDGESDCVGTGDPEFEGVVYANKLMVGKRDPGVGNTR